MAAGPRRPGLRGDVKCMCEVPLAVIVDRANPEAAPEALGTGDSFVIRGVLPPAEGAAMFDRIRDEVDWCVMRHKGGEVPRLVSMQAVVQPDGTYPLYRHPADEQPAPVYFTAAVDQVRVAVEQLLTEKLRQEVCLDHALVQWYRGGTDYISEHADKTLDIERGTPVVNVSFGATREMILRGKRECCPAVRAVKQRVAMTNNSMFVLGWNTNACMTHMIKQDKRAEREKRPDELAYDGQRISLTFRTIGTHLTPDGRIFGQGGKHRLRDCVHPLPPSLRTWGSVFEAAVIAGCIAAAAMVQRESAKPTVAVARTVTAVGCAAAWYGLVKTGRRWIRPRGEELDEESARLLEAFGIENRVCNFDWDKVYGTGFGTTAEMRIVPLEQCVRIKKNG